MRTHYQMAHTMFYYQDLVVGTETDVNVNKASVVSTHTLRKMA